MVVGACNEGQDQKWEGKEKMQPKTKRKDGQNLAVPYLHAVIPMYAVYQCCRIIRDWLGGRGAKRLRGFV